MSTKLSFKEALERRGETLTGHRDRSAIRTASVAFMAVSPIERPVDFIRLLIDGGVSMKRARMVLDRLGIGRIVPVDIDATKLESTLKEAAKLGIVGTQLENVQVDPRSIRDRQGLSQPEFASLYGIEVDTLKNWEQERNVPDGPARVLLGVIDRCPQAVIDARSSREFVNRRLKNLYLGQAVEFASRPQPWGEAAYHVTYGMNIPPLLRTSK